MSHGQIRTHKTHHCLDLGEATTFPLIVYFVRDHGSNSKVGTPVTLRAHNLCLKCLNGSCEPTLDIYVPRDFQWYKKRFNPMGFDSCNRSLKIRDSNSQNESSFGSVSVHSLTFPYTLGSMRCDSRASFLARTFVSPCLGCEPKVRVATTMKGGCGSSLLPKSGLVVFQVDVWKLELNNLDWLHVLHVQHYLLEDYCHNPNLGLITKARACKGVGQKWSSGVKLHAPRRLRVWEGGRIEPSHSQMNSHFGNWSSDGFQNLQRTT
jgi:hypothetical protein